MGGLGLAYKINEDFSVRGEYEFFNEVGKDKGDSGTNMHMFTASVVYSW